MKNRLPVRAGPAGVRCARCLMRLKAFGPIRRSPRKQGRLPSPNSSAIRPASRPDRRSLPIPHYVSLEGKWRVRHSTTTQEEKRDFYLPSFSAALAADRVAEYGSRGGSLAARRARAAATACRDSAGAVPAQIEIPYLWLDRDLFCMSRVGGAVHLCERTADRLRERHPYTRRISDFPGRDRRREYDCYRGVRLLGGQLDGNADSADGRRRSARFAFSQPRLRIEDFVVETGSRFGSGARQCRLRRGDVELLPQRRESHARLRHLFAGRQAADVQPRRAEIPGESTDTIRCRELLYHVMKSAWTPDAPTLYELMLYTRRDGRIIEYIPLRFGFRTWALRDGSCGSTAAGRRWRRPTTMRPRTPLRPSGN